MMALKSRSILVEPSDYILRNVGDMAMLGVAIERLARLFPQNQINVLTSDASSLVRFAPGATPLLDVGRAQWLRDNFLPGVLANRLFRELRRRAPRVIGPLWRYRYRNNENMASALDRFSWSVSNADLVVVAGMGGITDYFPGYASGVLEVLGLAIHAGRRTVMVGQGMGPLENAGLRARAAAILPKLDLIALREQRTGRPLLTALGVDPARIMVTGDDAIEMAYVIRPKALDVGIGLNVRVSDYSGVDSPILDRIREAVRDASASLGAPIIPVPISHVPGEEDIRSIGNLMASSDFELSLAAGLKTPIAVIRQIQRCRLVVTGSYHAGVFALASGIPVVGLAKSSYYRDKFLGLADMFAVGCETVLLDHQDCSKSLRDAIQRLYASAQAIRPHILSSAKRQIAAGHACYRRIRELASPHRVGETYDA
ncbi:colanic acid/amylovoran biosynthesis protein [Rhodospirillales bacterium URHD0017]|nr:colanic acid/amylovoran biosynthesis protein [Rhodospirillales bacterium URHD0017]